VSRSHRQRLSRHPSRAARKAIRTLREASRRAERRARNRAAEAALAQVRVRDPALQVRADALEEAGHLALAEALRSATEPDARPAHHR
jgi:hypothetical protein